MKRLLLRHFARVYLLGLLLALVLALSFCGCSVLTKTAGASVGAGIGSLGGPVSGAIGGGAGYLVAEFATTEEDGDEAATSVQTAVEIARGNRGFVENLEVQFWAAIRLVAGLAIFSLIASIGYSLWRKKKASPFYDRLRAIEKRLKD